MWRTLLDLEPVANDGLPSRWAWTPHGHRLCLHVAGFKCVAFATSQLFHRTSNRFYFTVQHVRRLMMADPGYGRSYRRHFEAGPGDRCPAPAVSSFVAMRARLEATLSYSLRRSRALADADLSFRPIRRPCCRQAARWQSVSLRFHSRRFWFCEHGICDPIADLSMLERTRTRFARASPSRRSLKIVPTDHGPTACATQAARAMELTTKTVTQIRTVSRSRGVS